MPLNSIYILTTIVALSGWLILFVSVFLNTKMPCVAARIIPAVLAVIYSVLILGMLPFSGGDFTSVAGLANLFAQPEIALVGWIHYLVFDLFIGAWQVQTGKRESLPLMLVLPSLLLTMVLGPLGLLVFLSVRYVIQTRQKESRSNLEASFDTSKH